LARIVRKVSNKAVKGQKKERAGLIYSKKFWIIIATLVILLVAAGITIPLVIKNNTNSTTTAEVDDYFGQEQTYKDNTVKFTKMTFQGVKLHTTEASDVFSEYTFVFATPLSVFYPFDVEDDIEADSKHTQVFNMLKELQYNIDVANEAFGTNKINLYIVDTTSKSGNTSKQIFTDSVINPDGSDQTTALFCLVTADGMVKEPKGTSYNLYGNDFYEGATIFSAINNAIQYVKSLY